MSIREAFLENVIKQIDEMQPYLEGQPKRPKDLKECSRIDGEYNALIEVLDFMGSAHHYKKQKI